MQDIEGIFEQDIEIVYSQLFNECNGDFNKMAMRLNELDKQLENEKIQNYFYDEIFNDTLHKKELTYALVKGRIIQERLKKTMSMYKR